MGRQVLSEPHISWSQLSKYQRCPRQYMYSYIEGLPERPLYVLASGRAVHAGLEEHNRQRARALPGLKAAQIVDCAVANLEAGSQAAELDIALVVAKDKLVSEIKDPVYNYLNKTEAVLDYARARSEADIEKEIRCTIEGLLVVGYVDALLDGKTIIDYKLVGKRKSQHEVERDGQLVLYRHALGLPDAGFVQLVRGREEAAWTPQRVDERIRRGTWESIVDTVKSLQQSRQTNHWPRCPATAWMCSPSGCQFFNLCYRRND